MLIIKPTVNKTYVVRHGGNFASPDYFMTHKHRNSKALYVYKLAEPKDVSTDTLI